MNLNRLRAYPGNHEVRLELHVNDDPDGGPCVIDVRGDLDSGTAATLRAGSRFVACHPGVIIDLTGIESIDQAGLGALIGLIRSVHETRGRVALVSGSADLDVVLRDAGLDRAVPLTATVPAARNALILTLSGG